MSKPIVWKDRLGSRNRRPWMLLVRGDSIITFTGSNIPGMVVVQGTDYLREGKWSHTTYRLQIVDDVRVIQGRDGWETGRFAEGVGAATRYGKTPDTWAEVAEALGVSVPSTMEFLRHFRPGEAAKLDEVDQALAELDDLGQGDAEVETVVVSFGGPSNRAIQAGYWESPQAIPGYEAEIRLIDPTRGWSEGNIVVDGMEGAVVAVKHSRGYHGGYYGVTVAVVPGTDGVDPDPEEPVLDADDVVNDEPGSFVDDTEAATEFAEPLDMETALLRLQQKFGR